MRTGYFLNLNLAQYFFNSGQSFALLLNQCHFLEFQLLVYIGLCSNFFSLLSESFLEVTDLLGQVKFSDLVFVLVFFGFLELILAIRFERMNLISDCLLE